jgi:hypothetical protein
MNRVGRKEPEVEHNTRNSQRGGEPFLTEG